MKPEICQRVMHKKRKTEEGRKEADSIFQQSNCCNFLLLPNEQQVQGSREISNVVSNVSGGGDGGHQQLSLSSVARLSDTMNSNKADEPVLAMTTGQIRANPILFLADNREGKTVVCLILRISEDVSSFLRKNTIREKICCRCCWQMMMILIDSSTGTMTSF